MHEAGDGSRPVRRWDQAGEGISFKVDYVSGEVSTQDEMEDLATQARKVGIDISLTTHIFSGVVGSAVVCSRASGRVSGPPRTGGGWIYGPDYLPTGESLYNPGAAANAGSYSDPKMTQLITATMTGPAWQRGTGARPHTRKYTTRQLPVLFSQHKSAPTRPAPALWSRRT